MARQYKLARKMKGIALTAAAKRIGRYATHTQRMGKRTEDTFHRRVDSYGKVLRGNNGFPAGADC